MAKSQMRQGCKQVLYTGRAGRRLTTPHLSASFHLSQVSSRETPGARPSETGQNHSIHPAGGEPGGASLLVNNGKKV